MSKICKNCKHWAESANALKGYRIGKCERVGMFWNRTDWKEVKEDQWERVLNPEYKNDKAFAQDGSDYMATLETLEDFGCVQFESLTPKE